MLIMQFTGTILSLLSKLFRAQSLNLSSGALVLPDVKFRPTAEILSAQQLKILGAQLIIVKGLNPGVISQVG